MKPAPVSAMASDLYSVLGVRRDADKETIKKAFRQRALKYHPDKNPGNASEACFKEASRAHDILSDPTRRALYDEFGEESLSPQFDAEQARQNLVDSRRSIPEKPRVAQQNGNDLYNPLLTVAVRTMTGMLSEWLQTPEGREASHRAKAFVQGMFGHNPKEPRK